MPVFLIQHLRIKCAFPCLSSALESEEGIENDTSLEGVETCVSGETSSDYSKYSFS